MTTSGSGIEDYFGPGGQRQGSTGTATSTPEPRPEVDAAAGAAQRSAYGAAPAATQTAPPPPLPKPATPGYEATPDSSAAPVSAPEADEGAYTRAAIEEDSRQEGLFLNDLLIQVLERKGSDLHLTAGAHPIIRVNGHLLPLDEYPKMSPPLIQKMMYAIVTQRQRERFEEELELDFAYAVPGKARFRVNLYKQREA
ncbi:MAG TPA: hypothetical protein VNE62_11580, partial [Actinomycetota bacterium]|nr:hypothetical protein [Actinomycetota bacterium]